MPRVAQQNPSVLPVKKQIPPKSAKAEKAAESFDKSLDQARRNQADETQAKPVEKPSSEKTKPAGKNQATGGKKKVGEGDEVDAEVTEVEGEEAVESPPVIEDGEEVAIEDVEREVAHKSPEEKAEVAPLAAEALLINPVIANQNIEVDAVAEVDSESPLDVEMLAAVEGADAESDEGEESANPVIPQASGKASVKPVENSMPAGIGAAAPSSDEDAVAEQSGKIELDAQLAATVDDELPADWAAEKSLPASAHHTAESGGETDSIPTTPPITGNEKPVIGNGGKLAAVAQPVAQRPEVEFAQNNHDRIVSSVRGQLLPHGGTMQIRMDPPELGALQVMVQMRDGVMSATFQTSNDEATRVLSHSLSQLKQVLEGQGITVEKLQVQQAPRNESSNAQDDNSRQQQNGPEDHAARQEQQRKEMLRRMWRKINGGGDPLDLVA